MSNIKRILFINKRFQAPCETELILKVGGYQVETSKDVYTAINRYGLYRNTESKIDLIVAMNDNDSHSVLKKLYQERYIEYLILYRQNMACKKYFCVEGRCAYLCNSSAILACVKKMQYTPPFSSAYSERYAERQRLILEG